MTARLIDDALADLVTAARQLKQSALSKCQPKAPFDAAYAQLQDLEQNRDVTLKQFLKVQESLAHAVTSSMVKRRRLLFCGRQSVTLSC